MEPHFFLKMEATNGAQQQRLLRKYRRSLARKAAKESSEGKNYPTWGVRAAEVASMVAQQSRKNRARHLARAFLKGTPYDVVENSVREGNEPNVSLIHDVLWSVGVSVPQTFVKNWVNQ